MKIYLNDIAFFGYHGLYESEKKMGNRFKLDIEIDFTPIVNRVEQIEDTIDYVHIYKLVQSIMDIPTPLLETLVDKIATQILNEYLIADNVFVKITKEKLFIPFFEGKTAVSIEKVR